MTANPSPKKHALPEFSPNVPLAEQVLTHAQSSREVVQDFVPLADSLEWELGQQYLRERGNKAFISDAMPVPFVINNDGTLSRNAAEVFFASLVEADKAGTLEDDIFVLELGIGVGLFARFFLDHFQELCGKHRKDFYDRLCYVAADKSERMLHDMLRHGVLANHVGHYCVRQVDALKPDEALPHDALFRRIKGKPFRAVFLNYLLDCLPAAVLEINGDKAKQLCVRTCVARNINLADHTDMTVGQLQERAKSSDPRARQELLEVYGLFASEYDYRPVDVKTIPHGEFAFEFGRRRTNHLLVNYGALQCLDRLLNMIDDAGFIFVAEYGQWRMEKDDDFQHQRFSYSTAVGLNFPLVKAYFTELPPSPAGRGAGGEGKCQWLEPSGDDERGIHIRLLSRNPAGETKVRFEQRFCKAAFDELQDPINKARECVKTGRFELAADFYHKALKLQPRNWVLINEIASFLTFQMRDPKSAIDMAKVALALNPACSAELWNTLGDALYVFGRFEESAGAFHKAMAVNSSDVRSRFNLAWVHTRQRDYPNALRCIAEALVLDKTGQLREQLLKKQEEVLALLNVRNQQEYLLLMNLVSRTAKGEERKPEAAPRLEPDSILAFPMDQGPGGPTF